MYGCRGEFPDVLRRNQSGLKRLIEVIEGGFEVWMCVLISGGQILSLKSRSEAWRADLRPGELI